MVGGVSNTRISMVPNSGRADVPVKSFMLPATPVRVIFSGRRWPEFVPGQHNRARAPTAGRQTPSSAAPSQTPCPALHRTLGLDDASDEVRDVAAHAVQHQQRGVGVRAAYVNMLAKMVNCLDR